MKFCIHFRGACFGSINRNLQYYFLALIISVLFLEFAKGQTESLLVSDKTIQDCITEGSNVSLFKKDDVRGEVFKIQQSKKVIQLTDNADTAISFACWIRPIDVDVNPGTIFGKHRSFYFRYLSNRKLQFNDYLNKDITTSAFLSEKIWQHVGFTLDRNGIIKIFFNGDVALIDTISKDWWVNEGAYSLGSDLYQISSKGFFDKVNMWAKVLKPEQVDSVYKAELIRPELDFGLQMFLPLEKSVKDKTGKHTRIDKHGTITLNEDSDSRKSAMFENDSTYLKAYNFSFDKQQTISLWIKPFLTKKPLALLGNSDFVLRFIPATKELWYSVPMQFGVRSRILELDSEEWIHVAVSVFFNHRINFFINGELVDSKEIGDKSGMADYLEIGKSIWGNSFQGRMSDVAVWDRALAAEDVYEVYNNKLSDLKFQKPNQSKYLALAGILMLVIVSLFFRLKKTKKIQKSKPLQKVELPKKNALYFFNSFKAYDKVGVDITNEFSPILIRLLFVILIYPKVYRRNITSEDLSNIFWPNTDLAQQKNNRNANIHKLRVILRSFNGLTLDFINKEWVLNVAQDLFVDIEKLEKFLQNRNIEQPLLSVVLNRTLNASGGEKIRNIFYDQQIEQITEECNSCIKEKDFKRLHSLSKMWLSIDSLSDDAIKFGIISLLKLGRKESALRMFDQFQKNYLDKLKESYPFSFTQVSKLK